MEKTLIHPLPPKLVLVLEEKHRSGGKLGPKGGKLWPELMPQLLETYFKFRALASHDRLEEIAHEIGETLDRIQKTIERPECSDQFTADCFRVYALMDEYVKTRGRLNVTRLPAVDVLIHAIRAHLKGNLHRVPLEAYAGETRLLIDDLVQLYKTASENFDEPTRQAFLKGIDSFTLAYEQLKSEDPEVLKQAIPNLKNGAELLHHLALWRDEFEKSEASAVPVVGPFVQSMLTELRECARLKPETLQLWVEEKFWDLQERWAKSRHDLFMPRPQKDGVVERIDSLMVNLSQLDQMEPRVQEQLLMNLEAQFEGLSRMGFDIEALKKHPDAWLVDLFVAVLAGGVPLFKIQELIEEFQGTYHQEYADLLKLFLAEKDRDYILDALAKLGAECEASSL